MPGVAADILDDLAWRGLIAQTTDLDALRADLAAGPTTLYCGFDPTAPSLHLGNLVPLFALRRFQLAGHRPIPLAGGATGLVGDPSGRSAERQLLTEDTVREWAGRLERQMRRFFDIDGPAAAIFANNLDWTADLSALDLLRDVGKHFPVNQMLARESVAARLESGGLSFTEFAYQVLQSYDYLELYRRHGCTLQVGATDQWGNIVAGLDLIRRVERVTAHALTFPLVTDAAGQKIGKSTGGGSVWLDPEMTSPYALYQYLLNVGDADVGTYLRLLTFLDRDEIEDLDAQTAQAPAKRAGQRRLAQELTTLVHGADETARVEAASRALFGQGDLRDLDAATLAAALAETPCARVRRPPPSITDLLVATGLDPSRSAAARTVREGGAYVNNARVADPDDAPGEGDLLHGRWLVVRKGKRSLAGVEVGAGDGAGDGAGAGDGDGAGS
jgi:tyrosyl-tRNA synthetase